MLLIPKMATTHHLGHSYLGFWQDDSNLSSFLVQELGPLFFISQPSTLNTALHLAHLLFPCPSDLQKDGT